jgi:predicted aspartyl protease
MFRVHNLLITLLVLSGCASELVLEEDGALAVIPHRTGASGQIIAEATVNGHGPFKFVIDTGASISVIYEQARDEAGVEPVQGKRVHVLGMTGTGTFPVADIREISIGSETWEDAEVALLPDESPLTDRVDGILGVDFLSRYAIWLSPTERVLRLYPKELVANRAYVGWTSIKLSNLRVGNSDVTVFAFDIYIEGERIPTIFDLGATFNMMNRRAARHLKIPLRRPSGSAEVYGITGPATVQAELLVWRLEIDGLYWRNLTFFIGEFPIFDVLGARTSPLAIAGTSFFDNRDFIIDFARERLLVRRR